MSDVQPMFWIADMETTMAWYRDRLGFTINVFSNKEDGSAGTCLASIDGTAVLITRNAALSLRLL